jgi:hypothetical protein
MKKSTTRWELRLRPGETVQAREGYSITNKSDRFPANVIIVTPGNTENEKKTNHDSTKVKF